MSGLLCTLSQYVFKQSEHGVFECGRVRTDGPPHHRAAPHITFHTRVLRATDEIEGEKREDGREAVDLLFFSCCRCRARSLARPLARPPLLRRRPLHSRSGRSAQTDRQTERACACVCVRAQCALQREFVRSFVRSFCWVANWLSQERRRRRRRPHCRCHRPRPPC